MVPTTFLFAASTTGTIISDWVLPKAVIPGVFGHVTRDDGRLRGDRRAAQALGDRETGINGRSGTAEGDVYNLIFRHLVDAHPTVVAGAPDRLRDASSHLFTIVIALQNARDLSEQVRLVHDINDRSWLLLRASVRSLSRLLRESFSDIIGS